MDKFAQKRSVLNQLREKVNMPGAYLEGFFKPELDRVMTALKALDDRIRSELTGKSIGTASEPAIKQSAKDLLKEARTAFNRREYMSGVSDLAMFHKKMQAVVNDIDKFFVDVNKIHHKFLFEGVKDDKINRLREHMEPKAASLIAEQLLKEAGLVDFLLNIGTKRGRGLAAWEKKYPKETKALRDGGAKLMDQGDTVLANAISVLKEMATARAIRRPDDYMDSAQKIKADFSKFDAAFKSYYQNAISPWMKIKDEIDAKTKAEQPTATPATTGPRPGQTELGGNLPAPAAPVAAPPAQPGTSAIPPMGQFVTVGPSSFAPPGASPPFAPPPKPTLQLVPEDDAPDTEKTPQAATAHSNFFESLESMSGEDPRILCSYITRYAKSIQGDDPETAITLFGIVKQLKG